jgi:gamma-glutamylcyclotransferase (GGCT)/AIG2-like uncharacterized protein YtfP
MTSKEHLFVYGTLRPDAPKSRALAKQMAALLTKNARHIGKGALRGQLYLVDWYPGLVPSHSNADRVHGDVYEVPAGSDLLDTLDAYEEATSGQDRRGEYHRRKLRVTLADGRKLMAWVYVYNRKVRAAQLLPFGDFTRARPVARRRSVA